MDEWQAVSGSDGLLAVAAGAGDRASRRDAITGRAAGGMSLSSGYKPPQKNEGLLANVNAVGA